MEGMPRRTRPRRHHSPWQRWPNAWPQKESSCGSFSGETLAEAMSSAPSPPSSTPRPAASVFPAEPRAPRCPAEMQESASPPSRWPSLPGCPGEPCSSQAVMGARPSTPLASGCPCAAQPGGTYRAQVPFLAGGGGPVITSELARSPRQTAGTRQQVKIELVPPQARVAAPPHAQPRVCWVK